MPPTQNEDSNQTHIVKRIVGSLLIYEITDYELEILEQGSPNSTYLNFAIFLISTAISFLITLLTTDIYSTNFKLFCIFIIIVFVGAILGVFLFILWYKGKSKVENVVKKIKARNPADSSINIESSPTSSSTGTQTESTEQG